MVIYRDALALEDWERIDRGLPPRPKEKVIRQEPEFPDIPNRIEFAKIPLDKLVRIEAIRKNVVKNKDGVSFIGSFIEIEMKDKGFLQGWISEGDLYKLLPYVRGKTDSVILQNLGWR